MYNTKHTILTGDFNMVEDPNIDRNPPCNSSSYSKGITNLNLLKQKYNMADKWRLGNPHKREFTWNTRQANNNKASRLDRIYTSDKITFCNQITIRTAYSDHSIVVTKMIIQSKRPRGQGYYKMNKEIFKDPDYHLRMSNTIQNLVLDEQNPNTSWDMFKINGLTL